MSVLEVAMFNEVFYHINKKCHEKIDSTLTSTNRSIQFTISTELPAVASLIMCSVLNASTEGI